MHTFPDRVYIDVDIFSCKGFGTIASLRDVEKTFSLPQVRVWMMERGVEDFMPGARYHGMVEERINLAATCGPTDA